MSMAVPRRRSIPTGAMSRCWAGALTPTTFRVIADTDQTVKYARLLVSPNADYSSPVYTSPYQEAFVSTGSIFSFRTFNFTASGLTPNTLYYYQVQARDAPDQQTVTRTVKTAPTAGVAAAFTFATSGCSHLHGVAATLSCPTSYIHRAIAQETSLLWYAHLDDLTYADPDDTTPTLAREHLARKYLRSFDVNEMCKTVPISYIPGDHDMAGNNTDLEMANGEQIMLATRTAYTETVPYYPFASPLDATGIPRALTQVFDIAKVRFLMFDCFSQAKQSTQNAMGSGLGGGDYWDQRTWFQQQLTQAATDGIKWLFLMSPRSWQDYNQHSYNDWFPNERVWICDQIEACDVPVCLIYGDSHIVILDDGTHGASYATDGFARFPVIASSATFTDTLDPATSTAKWNGADKKYSPNFGAGIDKKDGGYLLFTLASDNVTWTAKVQGMPINTSTFAPTTIYSIASNDVTPAVSFNNAAPSVAHGVPLTVNMDKTWFGACSVHWASSDGQSGDVTFKPNKTRASFSITFVSAGSPTITLSSPSGCTISGTNPATVTVS